MYNVNCKVQSFSIYCMRNRQKMNYSSVFAVLFKPRSKKTGGIYDECL